MSITVFYENTNKKDLKLKDRKGLQFSCPYIEARHELHILLEIVYGDLLYQLLYQQISNLEFSFYVTSCSSNQIHGNETMIFFFFFKFGVDIIKLEHIESDS